MKILEKHKSITRKNNEKKRNAYAAQNTAIKKSITQRQNIDLMNECIFKMTLADPLDAKDHRNLVAALNRLSKDF